MTNTQTQRHQQVRLAIQQRPQAALEQTALLWEQLATELIAIIGEVGFMAMYTRSLHICRTRYPWLDPLQLPGTAGARFSGLITVLQERDGEEIVEASCNLLITFVDILAGLIGDHMTSNILQVAWGDSAPEGAAKEFGNE